MTRRFTITHGAVTLGRARFNDAQVEQLMVLFSKERAWSLFDDLLAARDALRYGLALEDAA